MFYFTPLPDIHPKAREFWSTVRFGLLICNSRLPEYESRPTNQDFPTQTRPKAFRARRLQRIVPMANARKILIVEDDTDLRETLVEQLSLHDEFEASAVDTGAKGASAAKADAPDLALMDVDC